MWGNVAEWAAAIAAFLALGAAVWAGITSKRLVELELKRDQERMAHAIRQQASQFTVWLAQEYGGERGGKVGVYIQNSSNSPINNFQAEVCRGNEASLKQLSISIIPPGDYFTKFESGNWTFIENTSTLTTGLRPWSVGERWKIKGYEFTDASGKRWSRTPDGELIQV